MVLCKKSIALGIILIFALCSAGTGRDFISSDQYTNASAHSDLVTTASFYNDNSKYVTGSNDNTLKIWDLDTNALLHTQTYGDAITNIGLNPETNLIYVLIFDGTISVIDPDTYAQTSTFNHPNIGDSGSANYIVFDTIADNFILVGYDGATRRPHYHVYGIANQTLVRSIQVSSMAVGDEIYVCSLSANRTQLAMISANLGLTAGQYRTIVHTLSDDSEILNYNSNTGTMKWVLFSPYENGVFYTSSADNTVKQFKWNGATYDATNYDISSYGSPNCLNANVRGVLMSTASAKLVIFDVESNAYSPVEQTSWTEPANIFVFDLSLDQKYMVVGMQGGQVSVYQIVWQFYDEGDQSGGLSQQAMIGIIVGVLGFILILILIFIIWKFRCCKKSARIGREKEEESSMHTIKKDDKKKKMKQKLTKITIPPKKKRKDSDEESEEMDYDQLMAHGTIIVIKDDDKKKDYIKKLKKNYEREKDNKLKMGEQGSDRSSEIDWDDFVQGNIIIIRDDDHPKKKKKMKKNDDIDSDLSSNPDYQMLMADGNVIIIADDDSKKKYIKMLKKDHENRKKENRSDISEDVDYEMLMADENVIIIRDDDFKKKFVKKLEKEKDEKEIKHDMIQSNGNVLVIKDDKKKKDLINNLKKKTDKTDKPLDKQKQHMLEIAEQIIVIREDDDDDDEDEPNYEQLMAEGTVIVIKDDDTMKNFAKFVQKQKKKTDNKNKKTNKNEQMSEESEEPDFASLYVQGHVIIISDSNEKHMYTEFMRKNRLNNKRKEGDSDSDLDYEQIMGDANAIAIRDQGHKRVVDSDDENEGNFQSRGNVVVIGGTQADAKMYSGMLAEESKIIIGGENNPNNS